MISSLLMRQEPSIGHVLLFLMLLLCGFWYAVPLWDTDFWWHIASGRYIVDSLGIPSTDPFGVFPGGDTIRHQTVLKGQWLGQVILYLIHEAFGVNGIIAFRVLVLLSCLSLLYWRARILGIQPLVMWPLLCLAAIGLSLFGGERPQLLSFLFAALFFLHIDLARQRNIRFLYALPVISLVWANCHGGVILGLALLALVSLTIWLDSSSPRRQKMLWFVVTLGVFISTLLTPNGLLTYAYILQLQGSELQARTSEYTSALRLFELGYHWTQAYIYLFYLVALAALYRFFRQRLWSYAAITLFLALISINSFRYYAFFLLVASPYLMAGLNTLVKVSPRLTLATQATVLGMIVTLFAILLASGPAPRGGILADRYPTQLAQYVKDSRVGGLSFNTLEWGGYLIWQLSPRVVPFIDGRMLDGSRFAPYTHMLWATTQGQEFFNRIGFDLVIVPHVGKYNSRPYSIIQYLDRHPDWKLAFRDSQGVVFVRSKAGLSGPE